MFQLFIQFWQLVFGFINVNKINPKTVLRMCTRAYGCLYQGVPGIHVHRWRVVPKTG